MTHRTALFLGALALPVLLLPAGDVPAFQAEAKTTWRKTFTEENTFTLDSMIQTLDGRELSGTSVDMEGKTSRELSVTDECLAAQSDRVTKARRVYNSIDGALKMSASSMGMSESYAVTLESPLTAQPFLLTWKEDEGEYACRFDEGEKKGDTALLECLIEDTDYKILLPDEEVEEGGSWTVDLEDAAALFAPGGRPRMQLEELPDGGFQLLEARDVAIVAMITLAECSRGAEGELTATWKSTDTEGGGRVAEIALELEGELTADLAEEYSRLLAAAGLPARRDMVFDCHVELEGEGTLRWDLEAGHFASLELECESVYDIELGWTEEFGEIGVEVEVSGKSTLSAEQEAE